MRQAGSTLLKGTPTGRIVSYKPMMAPLVLVESVEDFQRRVPPTVTEFDWSEIEARISAWMESENRL